MTFAYDPKNITTITSVQYAVSKTGECWFQPTIANTDSPNSSSDVDKAQALAQCALLSPLGAEVVVS